MMKTVDTKYLEAIERNIANAKRSGKYKGYTVNEASFCIGVRINDNRFEDKIKELIKS